MIFRRWLFSTIVGTLALAVLVATFGTRHGWLDVLYIWLAMVGVNNLRIAVSGN